MLTSCMLLFTFNCYSVSIFVFHTPCSVLTANLRKLNQRGHRYLSYWSSIAGAPCIYTERCSAADDESMDFLKMCFYWCLSTQEMCPGLLDPDWKCVNKALIFTIPKEE